MQEKRIIAALARTLAGYSASVRKAFLTYVATGVMPEDIGRNRATTIGLNALQGLFRLNRRQIQNQIGIFATPGLDKLQRDIQINWVRRMKEVETVLLDVTDQIRTPALADSWKNARIGRRRLDAFAGVNPRELANQAIGEAFEGQQGRVAAIAKLQRKIENLVEGKLIIQVNSQIPTLEPRTMAFDPSDYAELVGITTTAEMSQVAYLDEAENIGTNLVKMPYFGKNYKKLGDEVCGRIDGKIFSILPEGSYGASGTWYPYLYSGEDVGGVGYYGIGDTGYVTPHPRCNHIARPIPEAAA